MFKKVLAYSILFLLTAISVELAAFIGVHFLQKRLVFYNPPLISTYQEYMANRHPVLGWPSKKMLREKYDVSGSRPIPAYPKPESACISLYGDSFTWSDSVDDSQAWSNQLSLIRKCRVSNYGVPGFGTDQALLRFESNKQDEAPLVLLNHFSGDIRRNVTQFRNLTSDDDYFLLKPRFILNNGGLQLIPLVTPTLEEAKKIADHPELNLPYEHFAPGGKTGIIKVHFPYIVSLLKALGNEHLQSRFKGIPVWESYYHPDHPSGALPLTVAIMKKFVEVAKARGKQPLITIIPNAHDIHYFNETGKWTYAPLVDALAKSGIETFDFGPKLIAKLNDKNVCELMEAKLCYGHYNATGYRLLAELLDEYLRRTT